MHSSKPGLGLRRGAVDLVDEHDVGEHRPGPELETLLALVVDVGADDVGGQQVRRALHARELAVDRAGQRPGERRLADARIVLDQHVALGEQRHHAAGSTSGADLHARWRCSPASRSPSAACASNSAARSGCSRMAPSPFSFAQQATSHLVEHGAATPSLRRRGTGGSSPPRVRIVTSLSVGVEADPRPRDVVDDDRVEALALELVARRSRARPAPCSAAKPTSTWPGRRRAGSAPSTSSVGSSSIVAGRRSVLLELVRRGLGAGGSRRPRRPSAGRRSRRTRARRRRASSAAVPTVDHVHAGGRAQRDVGGHDRRPRRRAARPLRRAR